MRLICTVIPVIYWLQSLLNTLEQKSEKQLKFRSFYVPFLRDKYLFFSRALISAGCVYVQQLWTDICRLCLNVRNHLWVSLWVSLIKGRKKERTFQCHGRRLFLKPQGQRPSKSSESPDLVECRPVIRSLSEHFCQPLLDKVTFDCFKPRWPYNQAHPVEWARPGTLIVQ